MSSHRDKVCVVLLAAAYDGSSGLPACLRGLSLVRHYSDLKSARASALGTWGAVAGLAAAAGPVVGGSLIELFGWRSIFLVTVPVGLLAIALILKCIPAAAGDPDRPLDLAAQFCAFVALASATFAIIEGLPRGFPSLPLTVGGATSVAAGAVFLGLEHQSPRPVPPLTLFRATPFSSGVGVGFAINFGFYGLLFVVSLFL